MRWVERFQQWRRRRRRGRAARSQSHSLLREFVYLDEVSVFSLISSRLGSIATEFTANESRSLTTELTGTTSASAGVVKGELQGRNESTRTQGTQVLRKATVQTTFRELYQYIEDDLLLRPKSDEPPDLGRRMTMTEALEQCRTTGWALPASELQRGRLLEVDLELETEAIYQIGVVMDSFLQLFEEAPTIIGSELKESLNDVLSMNAMLAKLLVGLIPLRGRAPDYSVVTLADNEEWLVHRKALPKLNAEWMAEVRELDVVALAEAPLFWKDVRRILFSASKYSVLCRIGRNHLHDDWTPVKLVDVVRGLAPEVARELDSAGRVLVASIEPSGGADSTGVSSDNTAKIRHALHTYGQELASRNGKSWEPSLVSDEVLPTDASGDWLTVEDQRRPFDALTDRLQEVFGISLSREELAQVRHEALVGAGLVPLISSTPSASAESSTSADLRSFRILDTEVIAIYW